MRTQCTTREGKKFGKCLDQMVARPQSAWMESSAEEILAIYRRAIRVLLWVERGRRIRESDVFAMKVAEYTGDAFAYRLTFLA